MNPQNSRTRLHNGVCSALVLLLTSSSVALGQTQAPDDRVIEEVLVFGNQRQIRDSILAKSEETRIADFLTQDELGRQPDLNVADSLRRLPGVTTVFDEDEGRYVSLRGLDQRYTYVSIDGGQIASTDRSDRDINIESIPPTAVKRLEVIKSVTPDLDGHSVGGVVNLQTRSAFDSDGFYMVSNAMLGWHENLGDLALSDDNPSPRIDLAVSNLFLDDTVGVFLSGTYFDKKRDQGRANLNYGTNETGPFVNAITPQDYSNKITRWNLLGKIEYRPSEDFLLSLSGSRFDYQYHEVRTRFDTTESGLTNQTATSGVFTESGGRARFDRFPLGQTIDNLQARLEVSPTDLARVELGISSSEGIQEHPYPNGSFNISSDPRLGYSYDLTAQDKDDNELPRILINDPSVFLDYDAFVFTSYFDGYFENEEQVDEAFADFGWNAEGQREGLGFKVGVKHRNLNKRRFDQSTRYTLTDPAAVLTIAEFVDPNQSRPYTTEYFSNFNYPVINADLFDAFFAQNRSQFTAREASNQRSFYIVDETVSAAYVMGTYHYGPHAILGGFRYERTEVDTTATLNNSTSRISRTTKYDHILPSVTYTYDLRDGMKIRAGYAEALGRPNHPELAGSETFDEANQVIVRANPELQPRESQSFDLAFDWMIGDGQFFSIAAFHKEIDNQISEISTQEEIDGLIFDVSQPINIDSVSVTGWEIQYADDAFEFLPAPFDGLGISANLTLLDGEDGPGPGGSLLSQPDYLFNIAGLYSYGPFSAKITYNVTDDRPINTRGEVEYEYEQLDVQLRYQINDNWQLQVESRNITNNPRMNYNPNLGLLRNVNDFGNSYWVGVSYRP